MAPRMAPEGGDDSVGRGGRDTPSPRPDDMFYEALNNGLCLYGYIHAYRWEELCAGCVSELPPDVQPLYTAHSMHYLLLDTGMVFNLSRCTTCSRSVLLEHAPGDCPSCVLYYERHRASLIRYGYGEVRLG